MKTQLIKSFCAATLALSLAACSSTQKNSEVAREPASGGTIITVLAKAGGVTEAVVEQEINSMLKSSITKSGEFAALSGKTYAMIAASGNTVLQQKLVKLIEFALTNSRPNNFKTKFAKGDVNSTVASIRAAKDTWANATKIDVAKGESKLGDAANNYFGEKVGTAFGEVPESMKKYAKTRLRNAVTLAEEMPSKKETLGKILENSFYIAKNAKIDALGAWSCVVWGDMRNEEAIDKLLKITSFIREEVDSDGGIKLATAAENAIKVGKASLRGLASVRKEDIKAVYADWLDLKDASSCGIFNEGLKVDEKELAVAQ